MVGEISTEHRNSHPVIPAALGVKLDVAIALHEDDLSKSFQLDSNYSQRKNRRGVALWFDLLNYSNPNVSASNREVVFLHFFPIIE